MGGISAQIALSIAYNPTPGSIAPPKAVSAKTIPIAASRLFVEKGFTCIGFGACRAISNYLPERAHKFS
ncbi:hypothetical protein DXH95_15335 [Sphingorhabdus pulchriflava]|uniref:Uncharacterized protein n=1 Tax=Sphingorhabdus pulchriflava TaxID=2292257 RepID=A0A371B245_9SPHN|nr:hypothetical protein DXH95_15335 [Sphingorhabdus pulchriflava]